ncbi:MAG: hypothetical protein RI980_775 [Bacteroidota bacterium]|jgi:hypothetical protein
MRKITFLVGSLLFLLNATQAQEVSTERRGGIRNGHQNGHPNYYAIDYRDAEPIVFLERGILFYVFPTGDFDFNIGNNNYIARRGGTPTNPNSIERGSRGIKIEFDFYGRIRRIGSVFVNYDYYGRIRRIGSVNMTYNSFALTRIGGMRLFYNYHGQLVGVTGFVNGMNYGYQYYPCPAGYNGGNYHNDDGNDGDFFYYKKDGSKEKMKKEDIDEIKKDTEERKRN